MRPGQRVFAATERPAVGIVERAACTDSRPNLDQAGTLRVVSIPRMPAPISDQTLDAILATQLTIAWAGEGRCSPPRLGWWDTDLIDEAAGGDFFARLLPQTHAWASLEAVREAARRTDERARARMADPDRMRTVYFLGFELDELLGDRLAAHKRSTRTPEEALALPLPLTAAFSKEKLIETLRGGDASFTTVPNGRQMKGPRPDTPDALVTRLAAALVPLAEQYPLPFYKLEG